MWKQPSSGIELRLQTRLFMNAAILAHANCGCLREKHTHSPTFTHPLYGWPGNLSRKRFTSRRCRRNHVACVYPKYTYVVFFFVPHSVLNHNVILTLPGISANRLVNCFHIFIFCLRISQRGYCTTCSIRAAIQWPLSTRLLGQVDESICLFVCFNLGLVSRARFKQWTNWVVMMMMMMMIVKLAAA